MKAALGASFSALDRWWFAPTSRYQLGVFRVLLCAWFGWFYSERLFARLALGGSRPPEFCEPPSLARWLHLPFPLADGTLELLRSVASVLLFCALVGLLTRVALLGLAAVNLVIGLAENSWGYTAHAWALPTLVLCVIACAPGVRSFSLDAWLARRLPPRLGRLLYPRPPESVPERAVSVWPVRAVLVILCLVYFSAGLSKLRYSGVQWADGQTLAFYLGGGSPRGAGTPQRFIRDPSAAPAARFREGWGIVDHAYVGKATPLGVTVARHATLMRYLSIGSLLWELLFPLALLGRWPRRLALFGGIGFHLGIGLTLSINFASYLVCYALFVDWGRVSRFARIGNRERRMETENER